VDLLEKKGHKVFSPSLAGLAEHSHLMSKSIDLDAHITDIVNVIKWESLTGVCLVAHSYGGFPASGALEQIGENVASIVWLDAFKPESGQKVFDLTPERFREPLIASMNKGESAFPAAAKPPSFVVAEKDAAFFASKATPQPIGTYMQPLKLSGAREKVAKKTYIRIPRYPSPVFDKALVDCRADKSWSTYDLADSGHVAMLDAPERLTEMLDHAA